jgi:hypothetical protein
MPTVRKTKYKFDESLTLNIYSSSSFDMPILSLSAESTT